MDDLDLLVNNLSYIENNIDILIEPKVNDIVAQILLTIGQATAYDTGISRELVKGILSDLGRNDLANQMGYVIYEFWNTLSERKMSNPSYTLHKTKSSYEIEIIDDGFYNQDELGIVSKVHPRQDNRVKAHQVEFAIDKMETGTDTNINKAFAKLEEFIVKILEQKI